MRHRSAAGPEDTGRDGKPAAAAVGARGRESPVSPQPPSQLDQALLQRLEHRLAAGVDLELAVDVLDVARHGLARQSKMLRDLGIAKALGDAPQDIGECPATRSRKLAAISVGNASLSR